MRYKRRAVVDFFFFFLFGRERISEGHPEMSSQCLWKCCGRQKLRLSLGEKSDGFRNRKSRARSGRPVKDLTSQMMQRADVSVREGQRITTR